MHVGLENHPLVLLEDLRHLALRILEIAEQPGLVGANGDAGRKLAGLHPVVAPSALVGGVRDGIDEPRAVRTCLDAIGATEAVLGIDQDEALLRLECRADRADLHARRIFTMVAHFGHREGPLGVGANLLVDPGEAFQGAFRRFHVDPFVSGHVTLDPGAEHARRHVVFLLAGAHAIAATDAPVDVDNVGELVLGLALCPPFRIGKGRSAWPEHHQHGRRGRAGKKVAQEIATRVGFHFGLTVYVHLSAFRAFKVWDRGRHGIAGITSCHPFLGAFARIFRTLPSLRIAKNLWAG